MRRTIGLAILALAAFPLIAGTLPLRAATEILYFGLLAVSYNLLFGYAGMLSFGHNATFGVAGYAVGLLLTSFPGLPVLLALVVAWMIGTGAAVLIGAFSVRLHGGYFSLLTLAFAQFLYAAALKWRSLTRGDDGLIVPAPDISVGPIGTISFADPKQFYWFTLVVVLVLLWATWRFTRSSLGYAVVLMRENDVRASFLGYNTYATKLATFTVAGGLAAAAGTLFALFQKLISPTVLDLGLAGDVVIMAMLGGTGSFLGPFVGAGVYFVLQDWLARVTEHWQFFMGLLLVLLVLFAPRGITGLTARLVSFPSRKEGSPA